MIFKVLVPVAIVVAGLTGHAGEASAKNNNKKSALIGGAAGLAVGAIGATLYQKSQTPAEPQRAQPEYTGSTSRPVSYQQQGCSTKNVELFDRQGNFVKNEKMRVCN